MATTNKMTNRKALTWVMENCSNIPDDVMAKLESMAASLDKKVATGSRKPSPKQIANAVMKDKIVEFMAENPNRMFTCAELMKMARVLAETEDMSNQKVSALVNALAREGRLTKTVEKNKSYFQYAHPDAEPIDEEV